MKKNQIEVSFPLKATAAAIAYREGWGIFQNENGEFELQIEQEANKLETDFDAWLLLTLKVIEGSPFHIEVMNQLKQHAPKEHSQWVSRDSLLLQNAQISGLPAKELEKVYLNLGLEPDGTPTPYENMVFRDSELCKVVDVSETWAKNEENVSAKRALAALDKFASENGTAMHSHDIQTCIVNLLADIHVLSKKLDIDIVELQENAEVVAKYIK
ncbi:hypothetical protein [Vibrio sp. D431a]|uniref:hypothetical protein n=1 Tax=Vibrio sp. D431a TaxID=2837388 RepID=UPI002556CCF1|nr:hypothetical protein [Vibrio sp. D431a]MDK9789823.1 hypothetical protein [Vibrio sp. D431a]